MDKFFYGELGYQAEAGFETQALAESKAIDHSIALGTTAISIWTQSDEILSVVVEGEIFDKRTD